MISIILLYIVVIGISYMFNSENFFIYLIIILAIVIIITGIGLILTERRNLIQILICIELILLSVNMLFVSFSILLDDAFGYVFTFFILTIAASESAIGLALLIIFYRLNSSINIDLLSYIKA